MTARQYRFADEYIVSGNAADAAIRAGYSRRSARQVGQKILTNVDVKEYISGKMDEISSRKTADAREVLEYLSSVMRGESTAAVLAGTEIVTKGPDESQRLKAAELLGKRFGIFTDKVDVSAAQVVFTGCDDVDD